MTPAPETLLLTLDVELGQKSSLKCKQLWHFITKFTIVFQNTPYYKLQGHSHLPPVTISAPGGASSVAPEMSKPQESALQKSHMALQFGNGALFEETRSGISTSRC